MTEPKKWVQATVFGSTLEIPDNKRELEKVCCSACYYATEPKCDCQCKGAYHGLGRLNKRTQKSVPSVPETQETPETPETAHIEIREVENQ